MSTSFAANLDGLCQKYPQKTASEIGIFFNNKNYNQIKKALNAQLVYNVNQLSSKDIIAF